MTPYTIIDDGQFRYPVLTVDVLKAGKKADDLRRLTADEYAAWCRRVPPQLWERGAIGTQGCIDQCDALVAAGAETLHVKSVDDRIEREDKMRRCR